MDHINIIISLMIKLNQRQSTLALVDRETFASLSRFPIYIVMMELISIPYISTIKLNVFYIGI